MNQKTAKRKFPNALVIVFGIMVIAAVLTWIIPAGQYATVEGTSTLDPESFTYIESTPVGLWDLLQAVYGGMNKSASVICFTLMAGGCFNVLIASKSVDGFICYLIRKLGNKADTAIPVLALLMSLLGATGVMANPVVAVIPIGLLLAKHLHMDQIVAVAVMFLAAYGGYATSPICAMTVQIAQKIAGLPMLSGFGFRCVMWLVFFVPTLLYIMHYASKIRKDPSASIMENSFKDEEVSLDLPFTWRHAMALIGLAAGLGIYTYCSLNLGWSMAEMATVIMLIAVFAAFITQMSVDEFTEGLLAGVRQMAFSAVLMGLASGVSVILTNGNILHTIIYGMAAGIHALPNGFAAPVMYLFNLGFNFFVNSGSGQATVVMPIMAPLADVTGITRQAAVTAFQLGDGLSNIIFPTSGTLMACLAIAGVDFRRWIKWVFPLFLLWAVMGLGVMVVIVSLGI